MTYEEGLFYIVNTTISFSNLLIENIKNPSGFGAILGDEESIIHLTNMIFKNNQGRYGPALLLHGSTSAFVYNSTFLYNDAVSKVFECSNKN